MPEIFIDGLELVEDWGPYKAGTKLQVLQPYDRLLRDGTVERRGLAASGNFIDQERARTLVENGKAVDGAEARRERTSVRRRRTRSTDDEEAS